jgi:hypothetical protein
VRTRHTFTGHIANPDDVEHFIDAPPADAMRRGQRRQVIALGRTDEPPATSFD